MGYTSSLIYRAHFDSFEKKWITPERYLVILFRNISQILSFVSCNVFGFNAFCRSYQRLVFLTFLCGFKWCGLLFETRFPADVNRKRFVGSLHVSYEANKSAYFTQAINQVKKALSWIKRGLQSFCCFISFLTSYER